jgi:uncharacterized protein
VTRVLVTGASGFVGSALRERLHARGDETEGVSLRDAGAPTPAQVEAADAIVNLAGESVDGRWTAAKRDAILTSRVDGTRRLVDAVAAASARPRVLVSASAIGWYGDRGDETLDEDSPGGAGFIYDVASAWEAEATRAADLGVRVVVVRFGLILGRQGGALPRLVRPTRLLAGGPLGSGRQWWAWVHLDDVTGILLHALDDGAVGGVLNATAPDPRRQREFARALGAALHRPAVTPAPAVALRLLLGGFASELLSSRRVVPKRTGASGYAFAHPRLEGALADLVGA